MLIVQIMLQKETLKQAQDTPDRSSHICMYLPQQTLNKGKWQNAEHRSNKDPAILATVKATCQHLMPTTMLGLDRGRGVQDLAHIMLNYKRIYAQKAVPLANKQCGHS